MILKKLYILIIVLMMLMTISGCAGIGEKKRVRQQMKEYLEKEYGTEAVVEKPELMGNMGFGYSGFSSSAYLKKDPDIRFGVSYYLSEKRFTDGYPTVRIMKQAEKAVTEELAKYYGKENIIECHVTLDYPSNVIRTEKMTYDSVVEENKGKIDISIGAHVSMGKFEEKEEVQNIKNFLLDYLMKKEFYSRSISICYVKQEFRSEYDEEKEWAASKPHFKLGHFYAHFFFSEKLGKIDIDNLQRYFRYKDYE